MKKIFLALAAFLLVMSFSDARIIHRTFELPAIEAGTVGYTAGGNYNKVLADGNLANLLVGNAAGDGFAGDARGYLTFPTYLIPKRFRIEGANLTIKYNSTSANTPKFLYLTDALRRVGNTNASQFTWYWNASKTFNITSIAIGSNVPSTNQTYAIANDRSDLEALKIDGASDGNDNFTLGMLLDKNGLSSNTFVRVFGTDSGTDSTPALAVDTTFDNGRGDCSNEVTGFRGTRLKITQNGVSFNATEYRVGASIFVNGVLYNDSMIDWELCYGWDTQEQFKFYANVSFPLDWIANNVIKNVTFKIHSPDDFDFVKSGTLKFADDIWNFNDLLSQAASYGLTTTERVRDHGYLITMTGFTPSTPYTDGNKLVLDPTIGETDWTNTSESVFLPETAGWLRITNQTIGNDTFNNSVYNMSSCANDQFGCNFTGFTFDPANFQSGNGYITSWVGTGDASQLGNPGGPYWLALDAHRYVCVNQSAAKDESVNSARQWANASILASNSSLLMSNKTTVYDTVYANSSLGTFGPRNFTWSFTADCARFWMLKVNSTVGVTNGPNIHYFGLRGKTYGENFTTNQTLINSTLANSTFGYTYAWTPDFLNATPFLYYNGSTTRVFQGTCVNNTNIINCTVPVNLSLSSAGTYSYYFKILNFMNETANVKGKTASFFNTSTNQFLIAAAPPLVFITAFIVEPQNLTYYNTSKIATFFFLSNNYSSATCTGYNNGVSVYSNASVLNSTNTSFTLSNLNHNSLNNFTVVCVSAFLDTTIATVFYSILHFSNTTSAAAQNRELALDNFTLNFTTAVEVSDVNATLYYNGIAQPVLSKSNSGVFFNFTWSTLAPFITTNGSSFQYWFTVNLTYSNGSVQNFTPVNSSQTLLFSVYPLDMSNFQLNNSEFGFVTPALIVGDIVNNANLTAWFNATYANGTATLASVYNTTNSTWNTNKTYSQLAFLGEVTSGNNESRIINSWIQVSYNGSNRNMSNPTFTNKTLQVYKIILTACNTSLTQAVAINMSVYDELTSFALYNDTIETNYYVWNPVSPSYQRNYAFIMNTSTLKFYNGTCIWPEWANYSIENNIVYYRIGYTQRQYFLSGYVTNVTRNVSLYLLDSTSSSQVIITVKDDNGNTVPNVTVQALRYFTGINDFVLVAETLTDFDGKASTYLQPNDVYYKFILLVNGTVANVYPRVLILCTSGSCPPYFLELKISTLGLPDFFKQLNNIVYGCALNQTSTVLTCTVIDTTGFDTYSALKVYKQQPLTMEQICSTQCVAGSCTLVCTLGNLTGNFYVYKLYAIQPDGKEALIDSGTFDFTNGLGFDWGTNGLLLAFLTILTLFLAGTWNPSVAVGLACLGAIASWLMGWLPVTVGSMVGLVLVGAIIVWKIRT